MKRCVLCGQRIWPWQSIGWRVKSSTRTDWWHGRCGRVAAAAVREHVEQMKGQMAPSSIGGGDDG